MTYLGFKLGFEDLTMEEVSELSEKVLTVLAERQYALNHKIVKTKSVINSSRGPFKGDFKVRKVEA